MKNHQNIIFPKKIYLSGEDYFYLLLEKNIRNYQTGNNIIRIIFHFESDFDLNEILEHLKKDLFIKFIANLTLNKGFLFFKPHWKYTDQNKFIQIQEHFEILENEIPEEVLNQKINVFKDQLLTFDVIKYINGTKALIFSWHHILFDGRGAGLLLKNSLELKPLTQEKLNIFLPKNEIKVNFFSKIRNLYFVKNYINLHSKEIHKPLISLQKNLVFKNLIIEFNFSENKKIEENAHKFGSKFGTNVYLLACCAQFINNLNLKRNNYGNLWIPVPYDGRKRGSIGPIITNKIAFVFYKLSQKDLVSLEKTIKAIQNQMKEQINIQFSKKFSKLLDVMRILPLNFYRFLVQNSSRKSISSFLFSSSGEDNWDLNKLLNLPYYDINIIPPSTFPPGITFTLLRFNGKLKINVSYIQNAFTTEENKNFIKNLKIIALQNK